MRTLAQTVLPFKLEATDEMLTANAGLALFGDFVQGLGFSRWLAQEMPKPGSGRGYEASVYVKPLVLMLTSGGRALEDLRTLKSDIALTSLLQQDILPSTRDGRLVASHWSRRWYGRPFPSQPAGRRHKDSANRHHHPHAGW